MARARTVTATPINIYTDLLGTQTNDVLYAPLYSTSGNPFSTVIVDGSPQ
jgi:hypothetical protein